jgi:hypothetical protein
MRHNLHEIPRLLDFADKIGINSVSTGAMVLCGRASESLLLSPPDPEQYLSLLERYDSDFQFRELYKKIGSVSALEWRAGDTVRQDCCSFIHNPYLTPSGRLYPCLLCHTDEYSVTGVFEKVLLTPLPKEFRSGLHCTASAANAPKHYRSAWTVRANHSVQADAWDAHGEVAENSWRPMTAALPDGPFISKRLLPLCLQFKYIPPLFLCKSPFYSSGITV